MLSPRETIQSFQKQLWRQPNPCPKIRSYGCAECGLWTIEEHRQTDVPEGRLLWDSIPP